MSYKHAPAGSLLAALLAVSGPHLLGQATAPAANNAGEKDDEAVVLSPFVIQADEDPDSYAAKSTLAGTRIRTDLKDVGSAIQVVTSKFLQDTGARSSQDLLVYTTSTEVGGQSGNFVGAGNGQSLDTRAQRSNPQSNTRVRGLAEADNTRDFFLTDIPWDSYNVGRVDLQRGPNSILFGIGSPAGIVNSSLNTATFKDANSTEFRIGSFGSTRESLDINKVILKDELAVRLVGLNDETKYKQKPAFAHDQRIFGALNYQPKFLKINGMTTSFRGNFESGSVTANRPRIIPPIDAITPWFTAMNKRTFDARNMGKDTPAETTPGNALYSPDNGPLSRNNSDGGPNPNYTPWLGAYGGQIFDQPVAAFGSERSGAIDYYFEPSLSPTGKPAAVRIPWAVARGIVAYHDYATNAQLPNAQLGIYKDKTLADPGIFDFYNTLIDGPNKQELQNFHTYNFAVSQTFFNNKLGFDAVYDRQSYKQEEDSLIGGIPYLTVEVLRILPDGRQNPNVGRPLVVGSPYGNSDRFTERRSFRFTGFGELNFKDFMDQNTLSSILGHHTFTGLYSTQSRDQNEKSWYSYVAADRTLRTASLSLDSRRIPTVSYLGPTLAPLSGASGADIPGIVARQSPYDLTILDFNANLATDRPVSNPPVFEDLVGWQSRPFGVLDGYHGRDRDRLIRSGTAHKFRDEIKSSAIVWQGYLWDDTIVPIFGYRKDTSKNFNAGTAPKFNDGSEAEDYLNPRWRLPTGPSDPLIDKTLPGYNNASYTRETGKSKSYSLVVHTPKFLKEKLPWGSDISVFYNKSDNFQPAGGRTDIFGASLASPTGKTRDYGITISTLNDRLTFKINWYKTEVKNSTLEATNGIVYRIGSNEAWGYQFAKWAENNVPDPFGANYALVDPNDPNSARIDPTIGRLSYQPRIDPATGQPISVRQQLDEQNAAIAALTDPKNLPPASFDAAWSINNRATFDPAGGWGRGNTLNWSTPSTLAVTGDTSSKGTEYELTAQPTPGWNITINAAKTSAIRQNLASSFAAWVDARNTFYQGPAGNVRLWNGSRDQQTVRSVWNTEFYAYYQLFRLQENADVPELRPWRVNLVSNYDFRNGILKGASIGGAYRWQDKIVVGYPVANGTFDISHPYKGKAESTVDLWIGYERRLGKRYTWRGQINVRNVFADNELIPITVQGDGSPATSRIPEPRVITFTNTFKF